MTQDNTPYVPKGFFVRPRSGDGSDVFGLADDSAPASVSLPAAQEVKAFVRSAAPFVARDAQAMSAEQLTGFLQQGLTLLRAQEEADSSLKALESFASLTASAKGALAGLSMTLAQHKIKEADFMKALWAHVVEAKPDLRFDSFQRQALISELHMDFVEAGETASPIPGKGIKKVLQSMKLKINLADVALAVGPMAATFVQAELAVFDRQKNPQPCLTSDAQTARAQVAAAEAAPYENLAKAVSALVKKTMDVKDFDAAALSHENRARYDAFFPKREQPQQIQATPMSDAWRENALRRDLRTVLEHEKSAAIVARAGGLRHFESSDDKDAVTTKKINYLSDSIAREKVVPRLASAFRRAAQNHVDKKPQQMLPFTVTVDDGLARLIEAKDERAAEARAKALAKETLDRLLPPPPKA
jgi:hypothetical protein